MGKILRITIKTEPFAEERAITTFRQGHLWTFKPDKTFAAQEFLRYHFMRHQEHGFGRGVPVKLSCTVFRTKPKSALKRQTLPSHHPDIDNYEKLILDALNWVLVWDDGQVTTTHFRKRWTDKEYGYITIKLEEDSP